MGVAPRIHDGAAGGESNFLESIEFVPKASPRVEMMDHPIASVDVDWQLVADLAV